MTDHHDRVPFAVTDAAAAPDAEEAVRAITAAAAVIERLFVGGADHPRVVAGLRLMVLILQKPPSICRRCLTPFRLENGVAFALLRRASLKLPKCCARCRQARRHERERAGVRTAAPPPPPENAR